MIQSFEFVKYERYDRTTNSYHILVALAQWHKDYIYLEANHYTIVIMRDFTITVTIN